MAARAELALKEAGFVDRILVMHKPALFSGNVEKNVAAPRLALRFEIARSQR
jgi:hypothetical protein